MTAAQRQELGRKIKSDLASLEKELNALEPQLKPITPDCSLGDLLRSEMMHDQEVQHRAFTEAKKRYNSLHYALSHLDDDDFGLCIECDEPIAFERLMALPESKLCIRCAKENRL